MPTYTLTLTGSQAITDEAIGVNEFFQVQASDGNPASCYEATGAGLTHGQSDNAKGYIGSTSDTWETLFGVTPGETITSLQLTSRDVKCVSGVTGVGASASLKVRAIDNTGANLAAGDLLSVSLPLGASIWITSGAGSSQPVNAGSQASSSKVRIELENPVLQGSSGSSTPTYRFDNIAIVATTTGGAVSKTGAETASGDDEPVSIGVAGPGDTGSAADATTGPAVTVGETGSAADAGPPPAGSGQTVNISASEFGGVVEATGVSASSDAAAVYLLYSDDDGKTWSVPVAEITGGTHPTISASEDGRILLAAYSAGDIVARMRQPGDADFGSLFTLVDSAGAALSVANDSFHLMPAFEGAARWFLACNIQGDGAVSLWASADDCRTWKRATTLTLPGCVKPTVSTRRDGAILFAATLGNTIHGRVRESGDPDFGALFVFQDDSSPSINLTVETDTFGLAECYEGPNRWILCVNIQGDGFTSEWVSGDRARSWKRVSNS